MLLAPCLLAPVTSAEDGECPSRLFLALSSVNSVRAALHLHACKINYYYYPGLGWAGLEDESESERERGRKRGRDAQLGKQQKITSRVVVLLV